MEPPAERSATGGPRRTLPACPGEGRGRGIARRESAVHLPAQADSCPAAPPALPFRTRITALHPHIHHVL